MNLELNGREYVIDERLRSGALRIKNVATNQFKPITEGEILDSWLNGDLRFLDDERDSTLAQRKANKTYLQELSLLKDDDPKHRKIKTEFHRRRKYVMAVLNAGMNRLNKDSLQPIINSVSRTAGEGGSPDPVPPSWWTLLYRWIAPFKSCNEDFRVLIPGFRGRGNRTPKFTGIQKKHRKFTLREKQNAAEIEEIIIEVKDEKLIEGQRCAVSSICDVVLFRINETNEFRQVRDKLPHPHTSSIYSYLNRNLNEYEKDLLRHGKEYAEHKYRVAKPGPIPTRPLERVEMDHTPIDLLVIDTDVMLPIGRPKFTSALDVFTKMDLGFFASFNYPGYLSVMRCLMHAIMPKTYVRDRYSSVKHDWPCYGIPETIVVDNAPEFHGESLEEAAIQLGFNIQYGPKGEAWYRGTIERAFGTKNTELWHKQPGTTFSNILDKGDYDPAKTAIISFDDFMELAHIFMIDIYPRQHHRGLKVDRFPRQKLRDIEVVPALLWDKAIKEYPPGLPPHREELQVLLGEIKYRKIFSYGIELEGLLYNSERLGALRCKMDSGELVKVKRDPEKLLSIVVADNASGTYFSVPAVNQEYTKDLTLWQHKKIKAFARQRAKDTVDIDDLLRAKHTMQEIVEREWKKLKKTGPRQRMANFKGVRQEDYGADHIKVDNQQSTWLAARNSENNMLRLHPSAVTLENLSDLESALDVSNVPIQPRTDGTPQNVLGALKMPSNGKRPKKPKKQKINSEETNITNLEKQREELTADADLDELEAELDIAGYRASFDLPK
jgi:putative transposase